MKTYLEKLAELRKEYSHEVCVMILSRAYTVEQVDRAYKLLDELSDVVHDLETDHDSFDGHHSYIWVSSNGVSILEFLVDNNVTQDELKLMLKLGE